MCGIAGLIHRGTHRRRGPGDDRDAAIPETPRAGFDRLRALRQAAGQGAGHTLQSRRAGRDVEGIRYSSPGEGASRRGRAPARRARREDHRGATRRPNTRYRYRIAYDGDLRTPRQLHRGRRRRRDPLDRPWPRADQGSGRCRSGRRTVLLCAASSAPTPSATRAWRPNRTSTSARPIRTGPTRSPTSRWCTTASSPTTGTAAVPWSGAVTASCRTAIPN